MYKYVHRQAYRFYSPQKSHYKPCQGQVVAPSEDLLNVSTASPQGRCERGNRVDGEVCDQKHSQAAKTEGHHLTSQRNSLDWVFSP